VSSPYITDTARKLLQSLTARGAMLIYNREQETWHLNSKRLIGQQEKAAKDIMHICAVQKCGELFPQLRYELSPEGLKILMRKDYVPLIIAARNRK